VIGDQGQIPTTSPATPENLGTESISVPTGQTLVREGALRDNQTMTYKVTGLTQGNQLTISTEGGTMLSLLAPNGEPVNFQSKNVSQWQGTIPVSGDYSIEVTVPTGSSPTNYKLTIINLAAINSTPIISPTVSLPMVTPNLNPSATPIGGSSVPPITLPR
jgi:hypothetical protein